MRKTGILLAMLLALGTARAQFEEDNFILSFSRSQAMFNDFTSYREFSVDVQYFVTDRISLNYPVSVSREYIHVPASVPIIVASAACFYGDLELLYMLLIPEGVSFHFPIQRFVTISPYINPLGFEYYYNSEIEEWYMTSAVGAKANITPTSPLVIAPFAEYKIDYGHRAGVRAGISVGLYFR